jgi:sugar/nucleoside kinase (ribokinase family)
VIPMSVLCSGSFVADIMIPDLPHIGPPGSLTYAPKGIKLSPGGHSANVAIDLAQLGLSSVHAVGSIGNDMMGGFMVDQLESSGVKVHAERQESTTAKNVALLVKGEDRRFIAELTANSMLTTSFLLDAIERVSPKVFYQGTLGGLPNIEKNITEILDRAHEKGALTFLDVIMPTNGWMYLEDAYSNVDIFHCNIQEGESLTGLSDPMAMIEYLIEKGIRLAIISDGGKGVTAGTGDIRVFMPAFAIRQEDATGTGDALCAGIINNILGKSVGLDVISDPDLLVDLLLAGQATGAACVTGVGATTNVRPEIIQKILEGEDKVLDRTVVTRK